MYQSFVGFLSFWSTSFALALGKLVNQELVLIESHYVFTAQLQFSLDIQIKW